jgi:Eukaryotic aspartyl protease
MSEVHNIGYFANNVSNCIFENSQLCEKLPSPMGESAVDCSSVSSMPDVSFTIGGKTFSLKAEEVSFPSFTPCTFFP